MTEREEQIYSQGQRQLVDNLLITLRPYLPDLEREKQSLVSERNAAVVALRALCEDFGDNSWPDNLHLGDVIEKHLARHLHNNNENNDE